MDDLSELPLVQPTGKAVRDNDGLHKRRGYWYYSLIVKGRRRFFSTKTKSYQEARKVYGQAQKDHAKGCLPSDWSKLAFSKAADEWIVRRSKAVNAEGEKLAENTLRIDRERLNILKQHFVNTTLRKISADDIRDYQTFRSQSVGSRTVNLECKVLRMILKEAKCWTRIGEDYRPLKENSDSIGVALTAERLRALIEMAASKPEWKAAYLAAWIASNTTMRGVELKRLRHSNVDLFARVVQIKRAGTKTHGGCRDIPLNDEAVLALACVIDRANKLGSHEPEHYVFPAFKFRHTKEDAVAKGSGYDPTQHAKTWRTAWRSLCKKVGLPKLRFHDLRHTAITQLAEDDVPIAVVEALAGHLSPKMTKHYIHIREKAKEAAVAKLSVFKTPTKAIESRTPVRPS